MDAPSDSSSSPHQKNPFMQAEVGGLENSSINLSPFSPTPHIHNLSTSFYYKFDYLSDVLSPRPLYVGPFDPLDFELSHSHVFNRFL